jgi:hypothetical protein
MAARQIITGGSRVWDMLHQYLRGKRGRNCKVSIFEKELFNPRMGACLYTLSISSFGSLPVSLGM